MQFERLAIPDVILFTPKVFGDDRGFFFESFNSQQFNLAVGYQVEFVQDNHSQSSRGVLRGLHYQLPPSPQGKLVRVARGEVYDVTVDIRRSSPTFGQWVGAKLSDQNHQQLWIPPGFAHGFITLSERADFLYKTTDFYNPSCERSIRWDDPMIHIDWHFNGAPILSDKDLMAKSLADTDCFD